MLRPENEKDKNSQLQTHCFSLQVSLCVVIPASRHNLSRVVMIFTICLSHLVSPFCLPLAPSLPLSFPCPLFIHLCACPSRWTPSTWVSWSFSGLPGWSSCWDRVTPYVFCYGPLYNLSRSSFTSFWLLTQGCDHVFLPILSACMTGLKQLSLLSLLQQALPYVCLLIAMLFFIYAIIGMQVSFQFSVYPIQRYR